MKSKLKMFQMGLLALVGLLVWPAHAENGCVEGGPYTNIIGCVQAGSLSTNYVLSPTNITINVGQAIILPIVSGLSITNGTQEIQVTHDCPESGPDFYDTNAVSYTFGNVYFDPPIPSVFWTPGTYTYTAKVVATGSPCSLLTNTLGTVTVYVTTNNPDALFDVDFSVVPTSAKTGYAAIGDSSLDFWNTYSNTGQAFGVLSNLKNAERYVSPVGLLVTNLSAPATNGSADAMYGDYLFTNATQATVTVTNLPAGAWNVYLYADDGNFQLTVGSSNCNAQTCYDLPLSSPLNWQPGRQYVVFTNVLVTNGQPLTITVNPGQNGMAMISGLQIATVFHNQPLFPPPFPAVSSIGSIVPWGSDSDNQTGIPARLTNVVAITAGGLHSLALKSDGKVVAWGDNDSGQTTVPAGLHNVVAIASYANHNIALKNDGTVVAWGSNSHGEGNVPAALGGVVALAAGNFHCMALQSNGTVAVWGDDTDGQTNVPPGLNNVVAIAAGAYHCMALQGNGTIVAWGDNEFGETNIPAGLSNVVAIAGGNLYSMALKNDGTVMAWGENGLTNVPPGLNNVVAIAAGTHHSLALKNDGTVVAWGENNAGQTNVPSGLSNVVAIAGGGMHSLALCNPAIPPGEISSIYKSGTAGSVNATVDSDYDGVSDVQEWNDRTDPNNPNDVPHIRLGHWPFDNTNTWAGDAGQLPLLATNVVGVCSWSSNAVVIDSNNPAILSYRDVETNGNANINLRNGTIRFWFKPDWSSVSAGGTWSLDQGRLIEMGNQGTSSGWWTLMLDTNGNNLKFITQANGVGMTNLTTAISWNSNAWHQIVVTYGVSNSSLYIDGQAVVTNGAGIQYWPNATERSSGFIIGGDAGGNNQARGVFDELETFNYPLSAAGIFENYFYLLASVVSDFGFELPVAGAGNQISAPTGTAWSYTGNSGVVDNNRGDWLVVQTPQGNQAAYLNDNAGIGTISQNVYFTNGIYTISFIASANGEDNGCPFNATVDGNIVGSFYPTNAVYSNYITSPFLVSGGYHTISFVGTDPSAPPTPLTSMIDDVNVNPEPLSSFVPAFQDFDFELPVAGTANQVETPIHTAWAYTGNSGVADNGVATNADTWLDVQTSQGNQAAYLNNTATITQAIFLTSGVYSISFIASPNQAGNGSPFEITVDGVTVGSFYPTVVGYSNYSTATFRVSDGPHTIAFLGTGIGPETVMIDDVNVNPEPISSLSTNVTVGTLSTTNLLLWLKADAITSLANDASLNIWPDSSGRINSLTQGDPDSQPLYVTNAINGYPVVRFDGVSSYLNLPYFMNGATQGEAFVVLKTTTPPVYGEYGSLWFLGNSTIDVGNTNPAYAPCGYPYYDGISLSDNFGSTNLYFMGVPAQPISQYNVYEVSSQPNNWAAWLNGTSLFQTNNNTVSFGSQSLRLGDWNANYDSTIYNWYFNGDVAEVIVFNRALTTDERIKVNGYLNDKYGFVPTVSISSPTNNAFITTVSNIAVAADAFESGGGTIKQVEFFEDSTSLGISTNFPYNMIWSNAPIGTYELTAVATGDNGLISTSSVVNITIVLATSVAIISPTNDMVFTAPANMVVGATVTDSFPIVQVQFFEGTTSLGIITNSPYTLTWSNVAVGVYGLTAVASDANGLVLTSSVVNVIADTDPITTDRDGDGLGDWEEYTNGTDPLDYYNGNFPDMVVINGNNQSGMTNVWLPLQLTILLTDTNLITLTNAPVTFTVTQGSALVAASSNGIAGSSIQLRTGTNNGQAAAWLEMPANASFNTVTVSAQSRTNTTQVNFAEIAKAIGEASMMAIGEERVMELTVGGDVISWGGNQYGELGDYTYLDSDAPLLQSNVPVHVVGLTNVVKIASGLDHSLAIDSSRTLWAWGQNYVGQLGDGDENNNNIPIMVLGMTNIVAIAAHGYVGEDQWGLSLGVKDNGSVWMWGSSYYFSIGSFPVQIENISNAVTVAAGNDHALALSSNGTVLAWGYNNVGQLGNATTVDSSIPVQILVLSNIMAICAGDDHSLAVDLNGNVWAWGFDYSGQLGDNGASGRYSSVPVMVVGISNIVQIAAGANHSLAIDNEGRLWAWGNDNAGQLGDGGNQSINFPMQVSGMTNIISIAAGSDTSVALDGNGTLWQWGSGNRFPTLSPTYVDFYNGQLPNLTITNGNNQAPHAGLEFPQPLVFQLTNTIGMALSNAPVSVEVIRGDIKLRTVSGGTNYDGLRLATDTNGEVSLIGYTERNVNNTNGLIRVLAASGAQLGEVDFNETLVPLPKISITNPANGSTYLIGTNQTLTNMVDAGAAPGASIQEVDYYYRTNGGADMLLGISTESPYSFIWTNALWWTNAFRGQYTLSAVAVDDAGARSDASSVTFTIALDSDGNGMPDYWQLQYFGHLGVDPTNDPDGDGISNLQEYEDGSDPNDYYNGDYPNLTVIGGNDQAGNYDSFLPLPVTIQATDGNGNVWANAPLIFTVTNGTALLAEATNDIPTNSLALQTDTNGMISVLVYFPPASSNPPDSTIVISAPIGADALTVNEFVPLGHWTFNDTNTWVGAEGQLPLLATNVIGIPDWSSNAVLVGSTSVAGISYNVVETNGDVNINCETGSVLFWFEPHWSSSNAGGSGPGTCARLIEMGSYNPDFTNGWWSLYLNTNGTKLSFGTSTNGGGMTNLYANISWTANTWYQIALTYSPTGSALYVDGQLLANGSGVVYFPNVDELTNGFRIGGDQDGNNQAMGAFDELETFNYPLAPANTTTYSSQPGFPDWWQIKYFNQAGLDPNGLDADGYTFLYEYQHGYVPNNIKFSISVTNQYVNFTTVPIQVNVSGGTPSYIAVLVNDTNFDDASNNWVTYNTGDDVSVNLNSGDGQYDVWVGLSGLSADAKVTWAWTKLILDTAPPVVVLTDPASNTVCRPLIQLKGYANEALSSLTYDISNATGIWTNQTGYTTGQFSDTNLMALTTNYFQCYDILLTTNGVNTVTVHAADLAGNVTTTNSSFTLDYSGATNPPALTVVWPPDGTAISGTNFTFQGYLNDPTATVTASIVDTNGTTNVVSGLVERNGRLWLNSLPLAGGTNTLTLTVTDSAGNTSVTNLALSQSPVTVAVNPLSSDQQNQPLVTVSGTISDSSYSLTVNGVGAVISSGTWQATNVPVNASGVAVFDVEVYVGDPVNVGSLWFYQLQPVTVGLSSYSTGTSYSGQYLYALTIPQSGSGPLVPAYFSGGSGTTWSYQNGGFATASSFSTGWVEPNWEYGLYAWQTLVSYTKLSDTNIPAVSWENTTIGYSGMGGLGAFVQNHSYSDDTKTRVMIEPSAPAVPGTTATYLVRAQAWDDSNPSGSSFGPPNAQQLRPDSMQIQGATLTAVTNSDGSIWGQTLVSAPAGVNVDVTPTAPGNYRFNVQAYELGRLTAVDNNRDGQIKLDNSDVTTQLTPYRFWINDSKESGDDESSGGADDQIPGQSPTRFGGIGGGDVPNANYDQSQIQGRSDLVNYFPVELCMSNLLQLVPLSSGYEYHLLQGDEAVKFVYTSLTPTNAFDYLTNTASTDYGTNFDEDATNADTITASNTPGTVLDTNWLAQVQTNGGTGVILVEGSAASTRPLMLEIWRNGKLLAGEPLYLSVDGVEKMFRHLNLCNFGNGVNTVDSRASAPNEPVTNGKNLVFLHGYNVNQQEARGVESEMFKRFYWSGSLAKFYGVTWNGAVSQGDMTVAGIPPQLEHVSCNLQTNVVNALLTAPHLASFLTNLSGTTVVAAHSLGNMVVLSAISDYGARPSKYFMIDCAVPMEAVQGSTPFEPAMIPSTWQNYSNWTFASSWWQLFANSDARSTLTWSNRLGTFGSVDIYNFFSYGEEVLREDTDDPPSGILSGGATQLINSWASVPTGTYTWVWEEKGKGNAYHDNFISSTHGGWRFPVNDYGDPNPVSPSTANSLPDSTLQQTPVFNFGSYYDNLYGPFPDLTLTNTDGSGSTYAAAYRDRILSDAIPAMTLPVGANHVDEFAPDGEPDQNINMETSFETSWPTRSGGEAGKWHHSDFDYVAYPFTHKLFEKIVNDGNLK